MTLTERSAYIKGLAEGLGMDESSKEGKLIRALIDLTAEMAEVIAEQAEDIEMLNDYIEEIDEDLGAVEEYLYDDEDEYDDFDECDGDCSCCDADCELAGEEDEDFFEVECPSCGEIICFDGSIDPEELACPACGEKFECLVPEEDLALLDGEEA